MRRGGYRPRKPNLVSAALWVTNGRWGRRRARTNEFWTLFAEGVYDDLIRRGVEFGPGSELQTTVTLRGEGAQWSVGLVVIDNPIWRFGRVLYVCPRCRVRTSRLYVSRNQPVRFGIGCRRCFGLSYASQKWSYRSTGTLGRLFGSPYLQNTEISRMHRLQAAKTRYAERAVILRKRRARRSARVPSHPA